MNPLTGLNSFFRKLPVHLAVILMCVLWIDPNAWPFRDFLPFARSRRTTGWWTVFPSPTRSSGPTGIYAILRLLPRYQRHEHFFSKSFKPGGREPIPQCSQFVEYAQPAGQRRTAYGEHHSPCHAPGRPYVLSPVVTYLQTFPARGRQPASLR